MMPINCPFCKAKPIQLEIQEVYDEESTAVHCMKCDAWGPTSNTIDDAILNWNKAKNKNKDVK